MGQDRIQTIRERCERREWRCCRAQTARREGREAGRWRGKRRTDELIGLEETKAGADLKQAGR